MRVALALALSLLLLSCGGGGSGSSPSPASQSMGAEKPSYFGYYFGCSTYAIEQQGKANLFWATGYCTPSPSWAMQVAPDILAAKTAGMTCLVLHLPDGLAYQPGGIDSLRAEFKKLVATKLLDGWSCMMLYPKDEPDKADLSDARVTDGNALLKAMMHEFPQLDGRPLGVFYACATGQRPGFATFDWIGCDDYNRGCLVTSEWDSILTLMRADQVFMAIEGAYSATRQDPGCFQKWLSNRKQAKINIVFTWQRTDAGGGLRDDSALLPLYTSFAAWALGG